MAHPTVVPFDISKQLLFFFSQRTETRHVLKQRCFLKNELKMHGKTLM